MFSRSIAEILPLARQVGARQPLGASQFRDLLHKAWRTDLDADELVSLLNGTRDLANRNAVLEFASTLRRPHDREVLLLPPLYFSSVCENRCAYCEFSTGNGLRLSLEEFENEFQHLVSLGFRSIELFSSQDPELYLHTHDFALEDQRFVVDLVLPYFDVARKILDRHGRGMLTTNIPPLDVASLARLRDRGLDCFLVWQETFDPDQYERLHWSHGPKSNQAFRLDSMEHALEAGIPHLAGAFLKGLHDWRQEEVFLCLFDRYLKKRNGRGLSIIGTPRVKGRFADAAIIQRHRVSDEDYILNVALDRILFDGILWLQTRESFQFNHELIRRFGGGVILTILSSTAPGGYAAPAKAHSQFPVFKQDLDTSIAVLADLGMRVLLDWDAATLDSFAQRGG